MLNRSLLIVGVAILMVACSPVSKEEKQEMAKPVNCATAEGDIRVLEGEKAHVGKEMLAGVSSFAPIGLVVGVATGTEGEKLEVAGGEYNKKIDAKIAEIKSTCGL